MFYFIQNKQIDMVLGGCRECALVIKQAAEANEGVGLPIILSYVAAVTLWWIKKLILVSKIIATKHKM